jgi:hypothetical protein
MSARLPPKADIASFGAADLQIDDCEIYPHDATQILGRSSPTGHPLNPVRQPVMARRPIQVRHCHQMLG